jgi:hypothetical protein
MTIKMHAPWLTKANPYIGSNGQPFSKDANNLVDVEDRDFQTLLALGFVQDGEPPVRIVNFNSNANANFTANCFGWGKQIILTVEGGANLTHTLPSAAAIAALLPNPKTGDRWMIRIINKLTGTLTLADGNNCVANGTNSVATNRTMDIMADLFDMGESVGIRMAMYNVGYGNAV